MSRVSTIEPDSNQKSQKRPFAKRLKRGGKIAGLVLAGAAAATIGTCEIVASKFDASAESLPCEQLELPDVPGAAELEENLCVNISGPQPEKIGVERRELSEGRHANILWLEWGYDGATEWARQYKPDAEPIVLITGADGTIISTQVRSHWIIGNYAFDRGPEGEMVAALEKARVDVLNAFHTPVRTGAEGDVLDPQEKGWLNKFIFRTVSRYAKAVGYFFRDRLTPLRRAEDNQVPDADHPANSQPVVYVE